MSPKGEVQPIRQGSLTHFEQTQNPAVSRLQTLIAPLCLQTMTAGLNVAPNSGMGIFMRQAKSWESQLSRDRHHRPESRIDQNRKADPKRFRGISFLPFPLRRIDQS
jgi:hypothetical protein